MFSFRGHTRFDFLQLMLAVSIYSCGSIWPWHFPWQLTVPVSLVFGLPAMARVSNGEEAKQRAQQEKLQEYFDKGGK